MKLLIKNKFVSMGGSSKVTDEAGNTVYIVKGKIFSIRKKKKICDASGKVLYRVRNKYWNFLMHSAFVCDASGEKICKVKQKFSLKANFIIEGYKDEISIEGNILGFNFTIYRNGQAIGSIQRPIISITDTFLLESYDDADAPFLVSFIIAIDNILDRHSN